MTEIQVDAASLTEALRTRAAELGFHAFGVAEAGPIDPDRRLRAWLDAGYGGSMGYMERTADKRENIDLVLPGARSVIALATSYYRPDYVPEEPLAVSRYAVSPDYHNTLRRRVRALRRTLVDLVPGAQAKPTIDTSPVLERAWAERAGIAWIGKSAMAINRGLGTYTFLATLVTDQVLVYGAPHTDHCGSCTRCLDACPTDAFVGPRQLDATRCITYWTVEEREAFSESTPSWSKWIAGCDVCQEVCPWNKFAEPTVEPRFAPRPELTRPDRSTFSNPSHDDTLKQVLDGTSLKRTGSEAIRRNALHVLKQ